MRAKRRERATARKLRREGRSLREISRELGVALSSVSGWTRDVRAVATPADPPVPSVRWEAAQICNSCGRLLLASDLHRGQAHCKECRAEYMQAGWQTPQFWSSITSDRSEWRWESSSARDTSCITSRPRSRTASSCALTAIVAGRHGALGHGGSIRNGGRRVAPDRCAGGISCSCLTT